LVGIFKEVGTGQGSAKTRSAAAGCKMTMRCAVLCAGLFVASATISYAQSSPPVDAAPVAPFAAPAAGPPAPRPWSSLSPEQQQLLQHYQGKWDSLPADRQQSLAKGSQRWLTMTPEQRASAQQRFSQWRAMPPEQRQVLRQRWQQFKSLPPEEQQRVRENFRRFRQMPPERRMELRRQWHQMSPEQRRSVIQRRAPPHR